MDIQYKIFKLKNGDSIISEVNDSTDDMINLHRPMMFKIVTLVDDNMKPSDIILFRNWAEFSKEEDIQISPDMVGASYSPDMIITNCYEMEKIKQDMPDLYRQLKKDDPLLPPVNPPMMPPLPSNPFGKQQLPPNMANFNLNIPIDVAKNLIQFLEEQGIDLIGPEFSDDDEIPIDDESFEEDSPNSDPFGNHPDDWSPDPNDYLK